MNRGRGFTLMELAVVMAIVGFLLGGLMYTLSAQTEQRNFSENERRLELAKELLLNFAVVNGRLPCPAVAPPQAPYSNAAGTGVESPAGGACTDNYTGFLPGAALGFQPVNTAGYALDVWGSPIRYAVSTTTWSGGAGRFTTAHTTSSWSVSQQTTDVFQVCTTWPGAAIACPAGTVVTNQNIVVSVIWSQGKNFQTNAAADIASGGASNDELANNKHRLPSVQNNHGVFVWHTPTTTDAASGVFDDQMVWIPVAELYGRMIAAGVLP